MYRPLLRALPRSTPSLLTPSTLRSVFSIVKPTTPRLDSPKQVKIGGAPLRIGILDRSSLHPGGIGSNIIAREQAVGTGKFVSSFSSSLGGKRAHVGLGDSWRVSRRKL